jgi:hypothetical protein
MEKGTITGTYKNTFLSGTRIYYYSFPDVQPASTIYYSLSDGGQWGPQKTFRTANDPASGPVTFIAGGDSRGTYADSRPTGWGQVSTVLLKEQFDFLLNTGDIMYGSGSQYWNWWYEYGWRFIEKSLMYYTPGKLNCDKLAQHFVQPSSRGYYSFEFGDVLVVSLDTHKPGDGLQLNFLRQTLQNANKTWKIVFFHRNFWSGSKHDGSMNSYITTIWKALDDFGVDILLVGHCHNYMRSKPINCTISRTSPVAEYGSKPGQGRVYIIAGGLGAPLSAKSSGWFCEVTANTHHYCKFSVLGNTLKMTVLAKDGTVIDNLALIKDITGKESFIKNRGPSHSLKIKTSPNPATGKILFDLVTPADLPSQFQVHNTAGKIVKTWKWRQGTGNKKSVTWKPDINPGLYLLRLRCGIKMKSAKLVLLK